MLNNPMFFRNIIRKIFFTFCCIVFSTGLVLNAVAADKCKDYRLLDGADSVINYGMDTTDHWWAITKPFSGQYRLIVDGISSVNVYENIKQPVFSPDGNHWAAFGYRPTGWELITEKKIIRSTATNAGEIAFSQNGTMAYSLFDGDLETIYLENNRYLAQNRQSQLSLSYNGSIISYVCARFGGQFIRTNGVDGTQFDEIKLQGIWSDGSPFYAGRQGRYWKIYKADQEISGSYESVTEMAINPFGTNGAAVCNGQQSAEVFLYSDEYFQPLESKRYDRIEQLVLHPYLPMVGFKGVVNNIAKIVLNRTEYDAGKEASPPFFTCDGSEFIYFGFDVDFFVSLNGKKYIQESNVSLGQQYAVMPGSMTFAYSTNSAMVVREIEKNYSYSGRMFDQAIPPRYNRRREQYETLALIGNRLILLVCKMN